MKVPDYAEFDHDDGKFIIMYKLDGRVILPGVIVNWYSAIAETNNVLLETEQVICFAVIDTVAVVISKSEAVLSNN